MASRLDQHQELIFDQLNSKAWSYRTVAANLRAAVDLKISAQGLRTWHISRSRKISERNGRLMTGFQREQLSDLHNPADPQKSGQIAEHLKAAEARVTSETLAKFIRKSK